jgi:hypothetical protein
MNNDYYQNNWLANSGCILERKSTQFSLLTLVAMLHRFTTGDKEEGNCSVTALA